MVGWQEDPHGVTTSVKWQNGESSALAKPPGSNAFAEDVNDAGLIVGTVCSSTLNDECQAVVWGPDGTVLGELPGIANRTVAESIEGNYVSGYSQTGSGASLAFTALRWTLPDPSATGTGSNVAVSPIDPATNTSPVTLTFGNVTTEGATTVSSSTQGAPPPLGFQLGDPPVYYELATTATFSGSITVCFSYNPAAYQNPANLRLFHGVAGAWADVTSSHDQANHILCGTTTSLSPFIPAELLYDFTGFFQPVDNGNVLNKANAGSSIPVKFRLGGNFGLNILAANSPSTVAINCSSTMSVDLIEEVTSSASGLHYEGSQYVYVWKTNKAWAGTCRKFILTLKDGTQHVALFQFK
jgi:hypothetical protein